MNKKQRGQIISKTIEHNSKLYGKLHMNKSCKTFLSSLYHITTARDQSKMF